MKDHNVTTTMFAATTPGNTPFSYHASTCTDPTLMISSVFIEANYEILESFLRDRRRQIRNEDIQTELEYFSKDYDEERETESRPARTREVTPTLCTRLPRVHRKHERVVGFEEVPNKEGSRTRRNTEGKRTLEAGAEENGRWEMNLPILLAAHLGRNENDQPLQSSLSYIHGGCQSLINIEKNIEDYPLPNGLKIPSLVGSYDGKEDPDNFLHLFEGAICMQKWLMPVACHILHIPLRIPPEYGEIVKSRLFARLIEEFRFALHREWRIVVRHESEKTAWPIMVRHAYVKME
uniref:Uncharacterized protein n=1 Tax=Tanacetum cinerariifolium TaxID=118510 RepID=A0A699H7K7_TANCI|nr:hypothetical protein [Tanacetum cinerariifolium]